MISRFYHICFTNVVIQYLVEDLEAMYISLPLLSIYNWSVLLALLYIYISFLCSLRFIFFSFFFFAPGRLRNKEDKGREMRSLRETKTVIFSQSFRFRIYLSAPDVTESVPWLIVYYCIWLTVSKWRWHPKSFAFISTFRNMYKSRFPVLDLCATTFAQSKSNASDTFYFSQLFSTAAVNQPSWLIFHCVRAWGAMDGPWMRR